MMMGSGQENLRGIKAEGERRGQTYLRMVELTSARHLQKSSAGSQSLKR